MFHSLRHRAPTRRFGNEADGVLSPEASDGSPLKPKACRGNRKKGGSSNSNRSYAMYSRYFVYTLLCLLMGVLLLLQSTYMMGDGFSSNGGVIGDMVDRWTFALYTRQLELERRQGVVYPDVQVKATRRMEQSHYSQYLELILRNHQKSNASMEPMPIVTQTTSDHSLHASDKISIASNTVKISGATASFAVSKANDLVEDLRKERCHSNWLCQRCLNAPFRGTYEACAALCRRCYIRILSTIPGRNDEPIQISGVPFGPTIPRIIHQAWHFYPSSLEYPEISRLLAGWRNTDGYEYYFYNGNEAQNTFVMENYPPLVEKALNSIKPRLSRLVFFRLLVLYKVGGVFADVDLMLETNLDVVIDRPTTFVAARAPGYRDNCLWVGFIAAAPGHPVIARAIENIIRSLLLGTHIDRVALERDLMGNCANPYVADLWKFRVQSGEYLSKGCSLGLAYNQNYGRTPSTASILPTTDHGESEKILVMAENDTGATRLTDISSNLLVASSNMVGLSNTSVQYRSIKHSRARNQGRQETVV